MNPNLGGAKNMYINQKLFQEAKEAQKNGVEAEYFATENEMDRRDVKAIYNAKDYKEFSKSHPTLTPTPTSTSTELIIPEGEERRVIRTKTETILDQVSGITDKLYGRIDNEIDFRAGDLTSSDIETLKLHLAYTKSYTDIARVLLDYVRKSNQ